MDTIYAFFYLKICCSRHPKMVKRRNKKKKANCNENYLYGQPDISVVSFFFFFFFFSGTLCERFMGVNTKHTRYEFNKYLAIRQMLLMFSNHSNYVCVMIHLLHGSVLFFLFVFCCCSCCCWMATARRAECKETSYHATTHMMQINCPLLYGFRMAGCVTVKLFCK